MHSRVMNYAVEACGMVVSDDQRFFGYGARQEPNGSSSDCSSDSEEEGEIRENSKPESSTGGRLTRRSNTAK